LLASSDFGTSMRSKSQEESISSLELSAGRAASMERVPAAQRGVGGQQYAERETEITS
jgi:hypothetical protein